MIKFLADLTPRPFLKVESYQDNSVNYESVYTFIESDEPGDIYCISIVWITPKKAKELNET